MRSSTRQERRRGAKRFKPQCEQLEVRAVPSAVPLLTSALDVNFSSTNLPADWQTTNWDPTTPGGTATVTGGQLVVDGARAGTQALFGPGRTLEFVATLSGDAFQNIGFGTDFSGGTPWAIFSTFTGGGLYARVSGGPDQLIAGNWLGTAHDFVINWTSTDITFSIDGNQVASDHVAISNSMRVLIGDFQVGGGAVAVSSLSLQPPGILFDGAAFPADWSNTAGTTIGVSGGQLFVDGGSAGPNTLFAPGQSLEFAATFSGDPYQHIGFGTDFTVPPFACFSTGSGGALYARTAVGSSEQDDLLAGNWLNGPHDYRIDWATTGVTYWIDGNRVAVHAISITSNMRPLISDLQPGNGGVSVGWMRMSPYSSATPSINTTPNPIAVTLGAAPVTLRDTADLESGNAPTGAISFKLYYGTTLVDTESATVSGNGMYTTPTGYTLPTTGTVTGTYSWVVSYGGDSNNIGVSDTSAGNVPVMVSLAGPTVGALASYTGDGVVNSTSLGATATLSGSYHGTGTITFSVTAPDGGVTTFAPVSVSGDGVYNSPTIQATQVGTYTWAATYSGDGNNKAATDTGVGESTAAVQIRQHFTIQGVMFYDHNGDGINNDGGVSAGWTIYLDNDANFANGYVASVTTDGFGHYTFTNSGSNGPGVSVVPNLAAGTWYIYEGAALSSGWTQTKGGGAAVIGNPGPTGATNAVTGAYAAVLTGSAPTSAAKDFGNLQEVNGSNGKSIGFWTNLNGIAVIFDGGTDQPEEQMLRNLNLVTASISSKGTVGVNFDPTNYLALWSWLKGANAKDMAYMLSAELASAALSVEAGYLNLANVLADTNLLAYRTQINDLIYHKTLGAGSLNYTNNGSGLSAEGFLSVGDLLLAANEALKLDYNTTSSDTATYEGVNIRDLQTALGQALDALNNNQLKLVA